MFVLPPTLQQLIRELSKLPSRGEKSAARLAYHLISRDKGLAQRLSGAILKACESVRLCERCFYFSEHELCSICSNANRDNSLMCGVEKPMDVVAIERVGEFKGIYHVLHGLWAPLRGQGPENMKLKELGERLKQRDVEEVILATSSTVEGDATALYIARLLNDLGIKSSRLAQGIPKGGELEYADDVTLSRAFAGRNLISL